MWKDMARQADLQELAQTAFVSVIFAVMLAKLVSMVLAIRGSLKGGKMRLERIPVDDKGTAEDSSSSSSSSDEKESIRSIDSDGDRADISGLSEGRADVSEVSESENAPLAGFRQREGTTNRNGKQQQDSSTPTTTEQRQHERQQTFAPAVDVKEAGYEQSGSSCAETEQRHPKVKQGGVASIHEEQGDVDTSDWEGVESTELDEMFGAASSYVATQAGGLKVPTDIQLQLYGLYKIATEGPCKTPQPSALKMSARAKWNAWQKLGDISPEEAMERYVKIVSEISPQWIEASSKKSKSGEGTSSGAKKAGMGPVFSTLTGDEVEGGGGLEPLHIAAREGKQQSVLEILDSGVFVDITDSDGGTPLHWACDRGHLEVVKLLLSKGANIHAKDKDAQTALHLATINEQEDVVKYLIEQGLDARVQDVDGATPLSLRPAAWDWMDDAP